MHPLAHHAGEDTLAPLLLAGGAWLSLLLAVGRARLAAVRTWLTRVVGRDHADPAVAGRRKPGCRTSPGRWRPGRPAPPGLP
jgi:hypothetical protein